MTPLSMIVAMTRSGVVGLQNRLPWHLPADLKRFKQLTIGHAVIMGRKTYESIGRPLPQRSNIVVSRNLPSLPAPFLLARSLEEARHLARNSQKTFVIGGRALFEEAWEQTEELFVTWIEQEFAGDVFFPAVPWTHFHSQRQEAHPEASPPHTFVDYTRTSRNETL